MKATKTFMRDGKLVRKGDKLVGLSKEEASHYKRNGMAVDEGGTDKKVASQKATSAKAAVIKPIVPEGVKPVVPQETKGQEQDDGAD